MPARPPPKHAKLPLVAEARPTAVEASAPFLRDTVTGSAPLTLPAIHLGAAAGFLVLGGVALVAIAPTLAQGFYNAPSVIATTHLFTLGVITVTIFGALSQLFPVAFGAPLVSPRASFVAWVLMITGIPLFTLGLWLSHHPLRDVGLALATAGFLTAGTNVALTLPRARSRGPAWAGVGIALAFFALTIVLGVLLAANLQWGFLRALRVRTLAVHLHLALLGWALVMIIGIAHRLLPFFVVTEDVERPQARWSLICMVPGTVLVGVGLSVAAPAITWAGLALAEAAVVLLLAHAVLVMRSRRKPIDTALLMVGGGLCFLAVAAMLAPLVLLGNAGRPGLAVAYVTVGLLGIILFITGVANRIAPFLSWISRFRARQGKERIPMVAELPSRAVGVVQAAAMLSGIPLLTIAIILGHAALARAGAMAFLLGAVLHAAQLAWVAWGRRHAAA